MRSKAVCYLFLIGIVCIFFYKSQGKRPGFFNYDRAGYYTYLPAAFIYDDIEHLSFLDTLAVVYEIGGGAKYALKEQPDGKWLNKYPVGVSIFEIPAFFIAHIYCHVTHAYPADGYSKPYEAALILNTLLWSFLGLLVLRRFLMRHFTDTTVAIVLVCIGFGTNFFTYTVFEYGMSHNYSFFLFACLLLFTDRWYTSGKARHMCFIAMILGLIVLVRPVNIFAVIIPLLWGVYNKETLLQKAHNIFSNVKVLLTASAIFLAIVFIQLAYWKIVSGNWLVYSYSGERFCFVEPKLIDGLFGFRKGWFIYTPLAFISIIGLWFTEAKFRMATSIFLAVMIYVTFSWQNWVYGYGFSARTLVDILPLLALPLGSLTDKLFTRSNRITRTVYSIILPGFILLNMFQSIQYSWDIISGERMTAAYYWRIFGKRLATAEDRQLLLSDQQMVDELKELNKK